MAVQVRLRAYKKTEVMLKTIKLLLIGILGFFLVETLFYTYLIKTKNLDFSITTVYKVFPVLLIHEDVTSFSSNDIIPQALSFGFVIVLNKEYDKDYLLHELTHAKQYYRYCMLSPLLYTFNQQYRVLFEYEAYMSENNKLSDEEFIEYMHKFYDITLSKNDIHQIIN